MNRVVIVGNGFDIACGLPTKYTDFLQWYVEQILDQLSETGHYEDELLTITIQPDCVKKMVCDLLMGDGECYIQFLGRMSGNYRMEQLKIKKVGSFLQEIVSRQSNIGGNWSDFEMIYFEILKKCHISFRESKNLNHVIELNRQFYFFITKFVEYLKSLQDILRRTMVSESMIEPFYGFQNSDTGQVKPSEVLILDFNITDLIGRGKKNNNTPTYYFDIHGNLDHPSSINFGFGDEGNPIYKEIEDNNVNEFFQFVKSFKYLTDQKYKIAMNFLEKDEFDVRIMGHSCGISDRTLLRYIFNHDKLTHKIHILHHDGLKSFTNTIYEISRCFESKDRFRDRVSAFDRNMKHPQLV